MQNGHMKKKRRESNRFPGEIDMISIHTSHLLLYVCVCSFFFLYLCECWLELESAAMHLSVSLLIKSIHNARRIADRRVQGRGEANRDRDRQQQTWIWPFWHRAIIAMHARGP